MSHLKLALLIMPNSAPLPSFPRYVAGIGFLCSGRMIPAEQMFHGVVGVNTLKLGKDRTGLQGVNRALLQEASVFHQKFLER